MEASISYVGKMDPWHFFSTNSKASKKLEVILEQYQDHDGRRPLHPRGTMHEDAMFRTVFLHELVNLCGDLRRDVATLLQHQTQVGNILPFEVVFNPGSAVDDGVDVLLL